MNEGAAPQRAGGQPPAVQQQPALTHERRGRYSGAWSGCLLACILLALLSGGPACAGAAAPAPKANATDGARPALRLPMHPRALCSVPARPPSRGDPGRAARPLSCSPRVRAAALLLAFKAGITNWKAATAGQKFVGWGAAPAASPCAWTGVACSAATGRVISLCAPVRCPPRDSEPRLGRAACCAH